ncbi:MAG: hypothetical protein Q8L48_36935 [Archangium sp.]|nr:hypothetical protein [Archangium sp.]
MNSSRIAVFVLLFAGCPQLVPAPLEPAPHIASFAASQTQVDVGTPVTLTWSTEGATEVTLEELSLGALGIEGSSGSVVVNVTRSSLFVLTARNARGAAHRAVVAVSVFEAMGDLLLTATPTELDSGESVTLAWSAPGATSVTLTSASGPVDLGGQAASGLVTVTPTVTSTYTLTAGTRTASVTVTVRPTLLTFTATPDAIDVVDGGAAVTLSWTTANAERVQLLTPDRGALVDTTDGGLASGSFTDVLAGPIDASRLFRYELQVSGAGRTVSRALTLPVRGNPVISTLTAPRYARAGEPLTVSWATTGAERLSLLQGGVEIYRSPSASVAASGSVEIIAPASNVTFEAVATSNRAESRLSVEVEVVRPPTLTLGTDPAVVARGAPFSLTWTGQSVRGLTVYDADGRVAFRQVDLTDTGTVPLTFRVGDSATFRAVADNGLGDLATASHTVTVTNPFSLTPSLSGTLRAGQRVELSWAGGEQLLGFPHDDVVLRPASTGFDDIAATGTAVVFPGTTRDDEVASITTPFRAPFYGRVVGDVITVSTNGYLSFGPVDRQNYVDVPLPSAKMEPLSLVPYWEDLRMASATAQWQVKTVGPDQVLIVQWTNAATLTPATTNTFQVKVWSTGQVDFEYQTMAALLGQAGVQGPRGDEGFALAAPPVSGLGVTFFAPKSSPVGVIARGRAPVGGMLAVGGALVPVSVSLDVVRPEELQLAEAMLEPAPAVGASGRWFELFNARTTPVDLTGWTFGLPDGGTGALSGTVPAGGVRVFGTSADRALNDDAGVDVQLTGFDVSGTLGSFTWGRDGAFGAWSWNNPTTGVSTVSDHGPYRFSTDVATSLSRPQVCTGSGTYGGQAQPQRGSPGTDRSCGFGYRWQPTTFGYYDISTTGTQLVANTTTATVVNVDLSAAPFPFFGVARNAVRLSADGYLTFDLASANNTFTTNFPSTAAPNSVIAIFADDLGGRRVDSAIQTRRVAAGEDPFAAAPHWIFQWSHWSHVTDDDLNFQVKLFDDGAIEFHFAQMTSGPASTPWGTGISANTWLENASGTQALVINASSETPGISPFTAYRISPR